MSKIQLHLHPFFNKKNFLSNIIPYFDNYGLEDLVKTSEEKNIDILGLERLNFEVYPELVKTAEELCKEKNNAFEFNYTDERIKIFNKESKKETVILRATEYRTKEDLDIIVLGYSGLSNTKGTNNRHGIRKVIDSGLENNCVLIMDHPFCNAQSIRKDITEEKKKEIETILRKYPKSEDNIFIERNGYCIPVLRKALLGGDVNKKMEDFCKEFLIKYGIKLKIVSDMDGHLRYKGALSEIEKGAVDMKINTSQPIIPQIKENIRNNEYSNDKSYVSIPHFIANMGVQYVFHKYLGFWFKDSRA